MSTPQAEGAVTAEKAVSSGAVVARHRTLSPIWWTVLLGAAFFSIALSVFSIFNLAVPLREHFDKHQLLGKLAEAYWRTYDHAKARATLELYLAEQRRKKNRAGIADALHVNGTGVGHHDGLHTCVA